MSNGGGACQTCKDRKIKCDGTKPVCNRCSRSRRICITASKIKQPVFAIHDETGYASGSRKRPRGPRPTLNLERAPAADLHTLAHAYYWQFHLQPVAATIDILGGLPQCVEAWTVSGRRSDMVDLALSTMALAVYSRTHMSSEAAAESASQYDRLVRMASERITQIEITKMDAETIDSSLLTIFLLSRFEGVMYQPGILASRDQFKSLDAWFHHDAANALLKVWIEDHDQHAASPIIMNTRRGIMRSSILRHRELPEWMSNGALFGEHGLALEYDAIYARVINLRYNFVLFKENGETQTDILEALGDQAHDIDRELQDWAARLPRTTSYKRRDLKMPGPFPQDHFYSTTALIFSGLGDAGLWSHFFSTRMFVNSIRLRIYELLRVRSSIQVDESLWIETFALLKVATDDLAATVPFCLERAFINDSKTSKADEDVCIDLSTPIKPYLTGIIIWPLSIATCLDGVMPGAQRWFRSELARLGKATGDAILEAAEQEEWPTL